MVFKFSFLLLTKQYIIVVIVIYLDTGGLSELGEELKICECYNPVSDTWLRLPDMNYRRAHLGVTSLGGSLYAVGENSFQTELVLLHLLVVSAYK